MSTTPPVVPASHTESIYNRTYWFAYAANLSVVMANALTFRFAELVRYLGGNEQLTGTIVSTGMVAALFVRLFLGQAIDRYGTRMLWTVSSVLFISGCTIFLTSHQLGLSLYVARILFSVGIAGMTTCSIVHIQNQVPSHRRTEVIGALGSSGFVGMITGTLLGDWIFRLIPDGHERFLALFGSTTALGMLYLGIVVLLTRREKHQPPEVTPPAHQLLLRYWPGSVLLVAMMMGISFTVVSVFLTRYATSLNLSGIGTFFTGYAVSAFTFRILTRRWSRTMGRHSMIVLGLAGHVFGHGLLGFCTQEWHFIVPSTAVGFGHALLFPAVVSLGAGAFPREFRGTGTTLILGFTEVGAMLFAPLLGAIIDNFGFRPMFLTSAGTAAMIAVVYLLTAARRPDEERLAALDPEIERETVREAMPAVAPLRAQAERRDSNAAPHKCGKP